MRVLSSVWFAWSVVGVLALALVVYAVWAIVSSGDEASVTLHTGQSNYAAASERVAAQDRSQPPHMQLEARYPGPFKDTAIQRWRDPVDGTICYIYIPVAVEHTAGPGGLVQYGAANIGTISCFSGRTN